MRTEFIVLYSIFCEVRIEFIEDRKISLDLEWVPALQNLHYSVVAGSVHCVPTALHAQGIPPGFLQA